jgi:formate/nitrite transporter FocA (FNT family)
MDAAPDRDRITDHLECAMQQDGPSAETREPPRGGPEHRDNVPRSETLPDRPKSIDKPEAGTRLSAAEIHDNILGPAEEELERSAMALLLSSFAAGLTIGFSFLLGAFGQTLVTEPYQHFIVGVAYPLGFVFVIFARSELFTENTLEPVIPFLHKRTGETFRKMIRMWALLIAGNLLGAALFAWVMSDSAIIQQPDLRHRMTEVARSATSDGFTLTLLRAIMAGWLIALLTWLLASTTDSIAQLVLIVLATAPIAFFEFRHSIAGSVEAFYRVFDGTAGLGAMFGGFIIPALIGNAIGGVVLVALLNFGQVAHERG